MSRESRLLLVTIAVSAAVLLLLAQLRFPEAPPALPSTAPLERLAARASFEELATRVAELETVIAPNLIVLRLAPGGEPGATRFRDLVDGVPGTAADAVRHVPALRVDTTTALAAVPPNTIISGIVGGMGASGTAGVVAIDPVRGLARVRVPEGSARALPRRALADLRTPAYIVAVEGTPAGLTLRPVFLGRSDRFQSPRWSQPLLPLGGIVVTPGALLFTLDGEFLGTAIVENGALAMAGAAEAIAMVEGLATSSPPPVDPGVALQPLRGTAAPTRGVDRGVRVAAVDADTPADGALLAGDVITQIDGQPVSTPEQALLRLALQLATMPVTLTVVRDGDIRLVTLHPPAGDGSAADRGGRK